jgi:hypothetical protein
MFKPTRVLLGLVLLCCSVVSQMVLPPATKLKPMCAGCPMKIRGSDKNFKPTKAVSDAAAAAVKLYNTEKHRPCPLVLKEIVGGTTQVVAGIKFR